LYRGSTGVDGHTPLMPLQNTPRLEAEAQLSIAA